MALTSHQVKTAQIKPKPYKLHDIDGLFLIVRPSGKKSWRLDYNLFGQDKSYTLGRYPDICIKEARKKCWQIRSDIEDGHDPMMKRKLVNGSSNHDSETSFRTITQDWLNRRGKQWTKKYVRDVESRLKNHVYPYLGQKPISLIKPLELLMVLRKLEDEGKLHMANRILQIVGQVFRYALILGMVERDISQDLRGAITKNKVKHHPILKEEEIPEFIQNLKSYSGHVLTKLAVEMLFLTMVRTAELRGAKWSEINFEKREWVIPEFRMKMSKEHRVHLSSRVLEILFEIKSMEFSEDLVFPNQNNPHKIMSENTILYALYRMGYHSRLTGHGFRGTASTILNEHGFNSDWIELQLAHTERNRVRAAYNHAQHLPQRKEMLEWWSAFVLGDDTSNRGVISNQELGLSR